MKIVVKLGTNVLTNEKGELDEKVIASITRQVAELKQQGHQVIVVSSGAVAAGKSIYRLTNVQNNVIRRQVYSSIGQVKLMSTYAGYFAKHGLVCAQVLATKEDFTGKEHYKNMSNCFKGLLKDDIIPVVNENDVVSLTELMFTDNDELAGLTAFMVKADKLIILSNVEGVFNGDPSHADSKVIAEVNFSSDTLDGFIQKEKSTYGRGGMLAKVEIARKTTEKGIVTYIANGKKENIIHSILQGESVGTKFLVS